MMAYRILVDTPSALSAGSGGDLKKRPKYSRSPLHCVIEKILDETDWEIEWISPESARGDLRQSLFIISTDDNTHISCWLKKGHRKNLLPIILKKNRMIPDSVVARVLCLPNKFKPELFDDCYHQ